MSPNRETNHSERKPVSRRKPRPKFEVPPEVAAAPPAPWVYRAEATNPAPAAPAVRLPAPVATAHRNAPRPAAPPPQPQQRWTGGPIQAALDPTSVMLAALETIAHTVAASTRIMLAAASMFSAPVEVTRKILGG